MIAYTYLVKCKVNNTFYYGVRWGNKVIPDKDLWIKYFTSSKYVKSLINIYGKDSFEYEVRKTFNTKEEAILWEETVLKRLKVLHQPNLWLNKTISKVIRYIEHPLKNKSLSQETKDKIGISNKGKTRSQSFKQLKSQQTSGKNHWNYGKTTNESAKQKNKITNQNTWEEKLKDPNFLNKHIEKSIHVKQWELITPTGEKKSIINLNKFCKDNNLHASNLIGKGRCKGWKLICK